LLPARPACFVRRGEDADLTGRLAIIAAAALWGCIGVVSVALFRLGVGPWEIAFFRAAFATIALGAWLALFRRDVLRPPPLRDLALLGGFGVASVGVFFVSFQLATQLTSVAVAVVLLYTAPLWVMVAARVFLREPLGPAQLACGALVICGVWATALGAQDAAVRVSWAGVGFGLASALAYSTYYLFGRRFVPVFGVPRTLLYSLCSGTCAIWLGARVAGAPLRFDHPGTAWLLLAVLALVTTLLANAVYYAGLRHLPAGRAAVIASVEPVVAALLAFAIFDQGLTGVGWAGVLVVTAGVAALPWAERFGRRPPAP
jgi:DME family drug/metabolite transporter